MPAPDPTPVGKLVWLALLIVMTIGIGVYVIRSEFQSLSSATSPAPTTSDH